MKKSPQPLRRPASFQRGFALIATLSMMILLTLIAVGLLSLSTVTIRSGKAEADLAIARANARLGLMIAINQLQTTLGPDQRVTATADIAGASEGARVASGANPVNTQSVNGVANGLGQVQSGTRYWTGVWGNSNPTAPTAGNGNIYEKTPSPVLLNWLVSGNENTSFTANASGQVTASNGNGGTIAPAYSPAESVTGLSTSMSANTNVEINGKKAALLVGPQSAGDSSHPTTGEAATDRYVVAPLVDVTSGTKTTGRYAYWVGDEAVKARMNLNDPYASKTNPKTDVQARARLMTAPRSGLEAINDLSGSNYQSSSQAANSPLHGAVSLPQLQLLDSSTITRPKVEARFHDLTAYSLGLQTDSYYGGLKRDLTYYLEQPTLGTWTATNGQTAGISNGILPAAYSPVAKTLTTSDQRVPRWDLLHSFYNLPSATGNTLTGSTSDTVVVRPASATQMGISPMVVQMRLIIGFAGNSSSSTPAGTPPMAPKTRRIAANILVQLANPYPATLRAPQGIQFKLKNDLRITGSNAFKATCHTGVRYDEPIFSNGSLFGDTTTLTIPSFSLSKGESALFFIQGQHTGSTIPLVRMDSTPPNPTGFTDFAYKDYPNWNVSDNQTHASCWFFEIGGNASIIAEFLDPNTGSLLQQISAIDPNRFYQKNNPKSDYDEVSAPLGQSPSCLGYYRWLYNQPGDIFPYSGKPGATLGIANSALRSWADYNPRASYFRLTNSGYSAGPGLQYYPARSGPTALAEFKTNLLNPCWGFSTETGPATSAFFDLPRTGDKIMSLAALQHANLDAEDIPSPNSNSQAYSGYNDFTWQFGSNITPTNLPPNPGHQPAYAVANSYQSIFLPREKTAFTPDATNYSRQRDNWSSGVSGDNSGIGTGPNAQIARKYYDISYLLNSALWDSYFLSTVPQSGVSAQPLNPRFSLSTAAVTDPSLARSGTKAAAHTFVNGAFNINSTSVDAWAAVLAGMKNLPNIPGLSSSGTNSATVFPRGLWQSTAANNPPSGDSDDCYSGYRQLTDSEIRTLAQEIVKQVRLRGPFVSLSHFVNRTLVSADTDATNGFGQSGPLQRAIDSAGLNSFVTGSISKNAFSNRTAPQDTAVIPTYGDDAAITEAGACGSYSFYADGTKAQVPIQLQRSTAIPGWLTQADVLQAIGSVITPRSDTFVIRSYGEALDSSGSTVTARAWCEAVVQRLPEYTDSVDSVEIAPSSAKNQNQILGRRFQTLSFRWLSPDEI